MVASNIGTNTPLPLGQPIELAFDRLLLPITVTRQSFGLVDEADPSTGITFSIAYDPVARVVTLNPILPPLAESHTYQLEMISPSDPTDSSGLHAIDGATMDPNVMTYPRTITFPVAAAAGTAPAMCNGIVGPCIDFCNDIKPIVGGGVIDGVQVSGTCISGNCHLGRSSKTPDGLVLSDPPCTAEAILATAIGRLSVESTMGALSDPGPPSFHFGQDMPIIDAPPVASSALGQGAPQGAGDPGNSFMMYKMLMAVPTPMAPALMVYPLTWPGESTAGVVPALSDSERATLASFIPGREMPLAGAVTAAVNTGLTIDYLERFSLWIAQGAPLSDCSTTPPTCTLPP
jgi:hypothetical protein